MSLHLRPGQRLVAESLHLPGQDSHRRLIDFLSLPWTKAHTLCCPAFDQGKTRSEVRGQTRLTSQSSWLPQQQLGGRFPRGRSRPKPFLSARYPCNPVRSVPAPMSSEYGTHKTVKARFWPWPEQSRPGLYRGTSLTRKRTPLGPYSRPMPRVLGGSWGGGRFLMGEVPLYRDSGCDFCLILLLLYYSRA